METNFQIIVHSVTQMIITGKQLLICQMEIFKLEKILLLFCADSNQNDNF